MTYKKIAVALVVAALALVLGLPTFTYLGQVQEACPASCTCDLGENHDDVYVECALLSLTRIPPVMPTRTISLDMSGNFLEALSRESFAHLDLDHLKKLDLTNTSLVSIAMNTFKDMPVLREVFLNDNNLPVDEVIALLSNSPKVKGHVHGNQRLRCQEIKLKFPKSIVDCVDDPSTSTSSPPTSTSSAPSTPAIRVTDSLMPNATVIEVTSDVNISENGAEPSSSTDTDKNPVKKASGLGIGLVGTTLGLLLLVIILGAALSVYLYRRRNRHDDEHQEDDAEDDCPLRGGDQGGQDNEQSDDEMS